MMADSDAENWIEARIGHAAMIEPYSADLDDRMFTAQKPFIAHFVADHRRLSFVASEHGTAGPTFRLVDRLFAADQPAWIILEGFATARGPNPPAIVELVRRPSRDDGWDAGEGAHAARLCLAAGIPFEGGEPTEEDIAAELLRRGVPEVDLANATLVAALVQNMMPCADCPPAPDPSEIERWSGVLIGKHPKVARDVKSLAKWWRRCFPVPLESDPLWCRRVDPGGVGRGSSAIREMNLHRDRHLYRLILERLTQEKHVGVVFGGSHLASLWRSLEAAVGTPRLSLP